MLRFLTRRLLLMLPILFILSVMTFSMIHLLPGDPAMVILGPEAPPEARAALREQLGLNRPLVVQYGSWVWRAARGDLGRSLIDRTPVSKLVRQRFPVTLELAVATFVVSLLIALPLGTLAALRRGTWLDLTSTAAALSGLSLPPFWLAMLLILLFAVKLHWLPAQGYIPLSQGLKQNLLALLMPAVATGLRESAVAMRFLRSSLLDVLKQDYVRTARAKGLNERVVVYGHALKNALIPVITASGLQIAGLLGGLVITETVFTIPGFGRLIVESIFNRDITTVQGAVLFSGVVVLTVNLLVDVTYSLVDPRIRLSTGRE